MYIKNISLLQININHPFGWFLFTSKFSSILISKVSCRLAITWTKWGLSHDNYKLNLCSSLCVQFTHNYIFSQQRAYWRSHSVLIKDKKFKLFFKPNFYPTKRLAKELF